MASENTAIGAGGEITALVGRLSEMSHLTTVAALDALIGAATVDDRGEAARLAKALADRLARSTADLQTSIGLD